MAPLKKQRIEISRDCISCPHTPGGATQPGAKAEPSVNAWRYKCLLAAL
jgi:hypothetical protein